eukprot:2585183-Amphidinium_carterae.1
MKKKEHFWIAPAFLVGSLLSRCCHASTLIAYTCCAWEVEETTKKAPVRKSLVALSPLSVGGSCNFVGRTAMKAGSGKNQNQRLGTSKGNVV